MKTKPVTIQDLKDFSRTHGSWFDVVEQDQFLSLESRDNGDVGEERAGEADKKEGLRLLDLLRVEYPETAYDTRYEVVDEWVCVTIRIDPLSEREREERERSKRIWNWVRRAKAAVEEESQKTAARNREENNRQSLTSYYYENTYKKVTFHVKVAFGECLRHRNHLGAGFEFSDAAKAEAAGRKLIETNPLFSNLNWAMEVKGPFPYGDFEIKGSVEFTVTVP